MPKIVETYTCESCSNCVLQDSGYSNYTVEGTEFSCLVNAHPNGSFDRWYGENDLLKYAIGCPKYSEGGAILLDVDGEWRSDIDLETKERLRKAGIE